MEAVKTFNSELYSLNDYKPPISKAKMTQITKSAIKAIKFYKHVVQGVEKFIQKCKPEYKVPGLYVIDSIVRQSRHQFGQEKDLFAPRFSNNIINTFQNLYRCPTDDKSKIVRVLNLWQKNNVFRSEIIQPLLDMAAGIPPPVVTPVFPSTAAAVSNTPGTPATPVTPANVVQGIPDPWIAQITNTDTIAAVAQILQSPQGQQLQQLVQSLHVQQQKPQPSLLQALDAGLVVQLQALTAQLTAAAAASNTLNPLEQSVSLSKLIDRFDFGEENSQNEDSKKDGSQIPLVPDSVNNSLFHQLAEHLQQQNLEHLRHQFLEQQQQQQHTPKMTAQENQDMMSESENSATPSQDDSQQAFMEKEAQLHTSLSLQQEDMDIEEMQDVTEEMFEKEEKKMIKDEKPRVRSKSRSRSPRKRRSRSRSGSRKRKHRKRSRSRSRERKRKTSRSYSSERRAREREKERMKKGLPPIRSKTLSVCSTTLWVGQVDKKATQQDLTNVFEEFGQIESINMIPPRGCAYVCMVHRQDAYRALQKLSSGSCKIGSKIIKIAWALNKGVKTEYKQFWDVDLGVTYIPWEKVKLDDLDDFAEGGMIDQETVNSEWQAQRIPEPVVVKEPVPVPTTTVQSPIVPKTSIITTQPEAYNPPVAMLQIPVTPTVPAVSLVPPAFPVSMAVPPPGYTALPPPPFMRASFNPSQPPPGYMPPPVPPPTIPPPSMGSAIPTALVPRLPMSTDSIKEVSYGGLMLPMPSVVTTSVSTPSVFNTSLSTQADQEEKRVPPTESANERTAATSTQSTVVSSTGILGVQPQHITASVAPLTMGGRIAAMPFLDIRPGLLHQPATARFGLLTPAMPPPPPPRSMLPPGLIDPTLHSLQFTQGEIFPRPTIPPRLNNDNALPQEEGISLQSSTIRQERDQDYRFPPIESRETVGHSSGGEQKKEGMQLVASRENEGVSSAEDIDINIRHIEDDHEPQDMAVVDPSESQEKIVTGPILGQLSAEGAHKDEREDEMHSLESLRGPDHHSFENKLKNIPDDHEVPIRPQLDPRQHFGSPPADLLLPFGRHPLEIRETFGRPPLEGRDHYGRPPPEGRDHLGRPPVDGRDHYGRPILEGRNSFGRLPVDGREIFGRPPLDMRDHFGRPPPDIGRREHFPPDKPWGHRGDFDERPHPSFTGFGGQKGFPDDRPSRHGNYRHEQRNAPGWNRGFESDDHRDYDDRRRSWERHRDRDDRDFGFRREVNGNRFGRERQTSNWMPPQQQYFEYFPEATTTKEKADEVSQVNGEKPETESQQQTLKNANEPELCEKETPDKKNEERGAVEAEVKSQPVVESTETEGT
ncbi:SR-related and CTD-associated factor 8 isoform X2 [Bufo gargarizans]|uniref:SR-related and CTD-associated factor 8 isoform X2 n=1 Tax=Bufo gargarizans TaxID=30331 RepID=UPI001CF48614|nr:SR-related and CTD-associated factor 8 isoform X2 [Bufo gargarizans]